MSDSSPRREDGDSDAGALRAVSGLHLAVSALCLAGLGLLFWHYRRMHAAFLDITAWKKESGGGASLREFFAVFAQFYWVAGAYLAVGAAGNLASALFIRMRRRRFLSIAVGCYDCLAVPLGTLVGIVTLVVLLRESVGRAYAAGRGKAVAP